MTSDHVDVLVVGAGLSGIGAAYYLQRDHPQRSYAILEARDAIGGTWDLFRYPGIRSDSDMHTLGYRFKPWVSSRAIADGPSILEYVNETAREHDINRNIRFNRRVVGAAWSSAEALWTVDVEDTTSGAITRMTTSFLLGCTGYYRYDKGFTPDFPGVERFGGELIHPQHWPEDLDYAGKRVVIIGSGATAVTLVPAMSKDAAHVTMLQRSPTYIVSMPGKDAIANALRRVLPEKVAYGITRWKNVLVQGAFYQFCRRRPKLARALLRRGVIRSLPAGFAVDTHFKPKYDPWDQRVCLVPDADLFRALKKGKASIATDTIETFTETGIRLASGEELEADIVVSATGLQLLPLGGLQMTVDGEEVRLPDKLTYKALMLEGVPNYAFAVGYTNASWTLKVDITFEFVTRLLAYMDEHGHRQATPVNNDPSVGEAPFLDFTSGYVLRSLDQFPKQGDKTPWKLKQNYVVDVLTLRRGAIDDGVMQFSSPDREPAGARAVVAA